MLGKTNTIAVVVPDVEPDVPRRAAGTQPGGRAGLIADSADSVRDERTLVTETRKRGDGPVLCAARIAQEDLRPLLEEQAGALLNRDAGHPGTPVVAADYQTALADLLNLMYGYRHGSLVYLSGSDALPVTVGSLAVAPGR